MSHHLLDWCSMCMYETKACMANAGSIVVVFKGYLKLFLYFLFLYFFLERKQS